MNITIVFTTFAPGWYKAKYGTGVGGLNRKEGPL